MFEKKNHFFVEQYNYKCSISDHFNWFIMIFQWTRQGTRISKTLWPKLTFLYFYRKKHVSGSNSFSHLCFARFIANRCCVASGQLAKSDAPFWFKVSLSLRSRSRLSRMAITAMHEHINSFCRSSVGWHVARSRFGVRASVVIYCHLHEEARGKGGGSWFWWMSRDKYFFFVPRDRFVI